MAKKIVKKPPSKAKTGPNTRRLPGTPGESREVGMARHAFHPMELKTSTERTRRFREKWAASGYRRLEITVGIPTIERLRKVAKVRKIDTYKALEQAVELLVEWHNADVAGNGRKQFKQ